MANLPVRARRGRTGRLAAALGAATLISLLAPLSAFAHPLGNFTINRYSGIEVAGSDLRVHYVLDMAEIPAFQEKQQMAVDPTQLEAAVPAYLDRKVPELVRNVSVKIDGHPVALKILDRALTFPPGAAGLTTLRIEILLSAPTGVGVHSLELADVNYEGRLGWREITAKASGGAQLQQSDVPRNSISNELKAYPTDRIASPLNISHAQIKFQPGIGSGNVPGFLNRATGGFRVIQDRYAELVATRTITPLAFIIALALAVGLGAAHALSPGHGKAVMAAYLVGTHKSARHAMILGSSITVTHTLGVFALGLITLFATAFISPERLYPWLTLVSGLLVLGLGATLVVARTRLALAQGRSARADGRADHGHDHAAGHDHGAGHGHDRPHNEAVVEAAHDHGFGSHTHAVPQKRGVRQVIAMGVFGGLLPCPSALVLLLSAFSLHRIAFGVVLIVAFSAGLAVVLTGIGIALATGTPLLKRLPGGGRFMKGARFASVGGAVVITIAGIGLTIQALPGVH